MRKLALHFEDFTDLGIWTKLDSPFICTEPWIGHADFSNADGELTANTATSH